MTPRQHSSLVLSAFVLPLLAYSEARAHPGIGIVEDQRGNVYFTDLKQVWKIAADGKKSIAVPNVHTHELCLDAEGNLFGEHLWYEGDATKKWRHRVWRLATDGSVTDVEAAREGFLSDDSLVRDGAGNRYWIPQDEKNVIKERSPDGRITNHATADFVDPRWMTVTAAGTLYLIDNGNLQRVSQNGEVSTLAKRLSGRSPAPDNVTARHYHMGLWTDSDESVYVAVAAEKLVLKVDTRGNTTVVARTGNQWSPSGGMIDRNGNLWVLEYSTTNELRVRRIYSDGKTQVF